MKQQIKITKLTSMGLLFDKIIQSTIHTPSGKKLFSGKEKCMGVAD